VKLTQTSVAILMGGDSRRFGSDKSRCLFDAQPLYRRLYDRWAPHFADVACIVRTTGTVTDPDIPEHSDLIPGLGPLGGILTALHYADRPYCFVTAVDLPFLPVELPGHLAVYLTEADIVVPQKEGRLEPLAAFYSRDCLPPIRAAIERGESRVRSFWEAVRVRTVIVEDEIPAGIEDNAFTNLNYPEDYQRAREVASRTG